jgi:hypothetical protein
VKQSLFLMAVAAALASSAAKAADIQTAPPPAEFKKVSSLVQLPDCIPGLGAATAGLRVDHTDVAFNPGHPGMMEPHHRITEWLISASAQDKLP